jgi:hypothetical protein
MTPEQPDLRPPGSLPEAADPAGSGRVAVWLGLVLLLGLAVAVVVFLPTYTATDRRDPPPASEPAREVLPVEPAAPADAGARLSAEQVLRAYLRLRARLELENAPVWGDSEWDEAAAEVKRGDRLFLQNDFISARPTGRVSSDSRHSKRVGGSGSTPHCAMAHRRWPKGVSRRQ